MNDIRDEVETDKLEEKRDMKITAAISAFFASALSIGGIATLMTAA